MDRWHSKSPLTPSQPRFLDMIRDSLNNQILYHSQGSYLTMLKVNRATYLHPISMPGIAYRILPPAACALLASINTVRLKLFG